MSSNQKFLALRVSFNSNTQYNMSYNFTSRFAPTTEERVDNQLSLVLSEWASGLVREFDTDVSRYVLTSCSDSGSDVKRTLDILMGLWWEWGISHMSYLALTDAFGTLIDPSKSKNSEGRDTFQEVKKSMNPLKNRNTCKNRLRQLC